jgi:hypothetical protein
LDPRGPETIAPRPRFRNPEKSRTGPARSVCAGLRRYLLLRTLRRPAIFGLSIPVAFAAPTAATVMWALVAVAGIVIGRTAPFAPAEPDPGPESEPGF